MDGKFRPGFAIRSDQTTLACKCGGPQLRCLTCLTFSLVLLLAGSVPACATFLYSPKIVRSVKRPVASSIIGCIVNSYMCSTLRCAPRTYKNCSSAGNQKEKKKRASSVFCLSLSLRQVWIRLDHTARQHPDHSSAATLILFLICIAYAYKFNSMASLPTIRKRKEIQS